MDMKQTGDTFSWDQFAYEIGTLQDMQESARAILGAAHCMRHNYDLYNSALELRDKIIDYCAPRLDKADDYLAKYGTIIAEEPAVFPTEVKAGLPVSRTYSGGGDTYFVRYHGDHGRVSSLRITIRRESDNPILQMRKKAHMTQTNFGQYLGGIPLRTIQNWEKGVNACPQYLIDLISYKLISEGIIARDDA